MQMYMSLNVERWNGMMPSVEGRNGMMTSVERRDGMITSVERLNGMLTGMMTGVGGGVVLFHPPDDHWRPHRLDQPGLLPSSSHRMDSLIF